MTITIPLWILYALLTCIAIPIIIFIIFCVWFTITWMKSGKDSSWYL